MKGDGWAVKRYICPRCYRKGLYCRSFDYETTWKCMYKNCESKTGARITREEVNAINPELINQQPKYKP